MAKQNLDNPFNPGIGNAPAYLAGRSKEKSIIEKTLKAINGPKLTGGKLKQPPRRPITLSGPRGVGKTCLLQWAQDLAQKQGIPAIRVVYLRKGDSKEGTLQELTQRLIDGKGKETTSSGFQLKLPQLASYKKEWRREPSDVSYRQVVQARLSEGPLAIMMDEVHHYDDEYLALILQHSQEMISNGYPLAIMLVGTPQMESFLMRVSTTYMNRCKTIRINKLTTEETSRALHKPFLDNGIEVSEDALKFMTDITDLYPYFVQVVGQAVWEKMIEQDRQDVDLALVQQSKAEMDYERNIFYDSIYGEMYKAKLIPFVLQGIDILAEHEQKIRLEMLVEKLQKRNPDMGQDRAVEVAEGLVDWGLMWKEVDWLIPGVPSLASYLQARIGEQSRV